VSCMFLVVFELFRCVFWVMLVVDLRFFFFRLIVIAL